MVDYRWFYRLGLRPWERYPHVAAHSVDERLGRESDEHGTPPGRVLDVGCGRGVYAPGLVRRGWDYVGVDVVPRAVEQAGRRGPDGATFRVADATDLPADLGTFDLFLDVGCFQGLAEEGRRGEAASITRLARPGATLLMMQFQPVRILWFAGGVSPEDVTTAFAGWRVLDVERATTAGLGWPMSRTSPTWYRLEWPRAA